MRIGRSYVVLSDGEIDDIDQMKPYLWEWRARSLDL